MGANLDWGVNLDWGAGMGGQEKQREGARQKGEIKGMVHSLQYLWYFGDKEEAMGKCEVEGIEGVSGFLMDRLILYRL